MKADQYQVYQGEESYEVPLPKGDLQLDYEVMADGPVSVYLGLAGKVLPVDHGSKVSGMLLVCDAELVIVKPVKKATMCAISVYSAPRKLIDYNDGKPHTVHLPVPPVVNLQEMAMRLVGAKLEAPDVDITPEELADMYPDDVDTEFGAGYVQLEEDEEIYDALSKREKDSKSGKGSAKEREAPRGRGEAKDEGREGGDKSSKRGEAKKQEDDAGGP